MRLVPLLDDARSMKRPMPTLGELHVLEHLARILANKADVEIFFQPKIGSLRPDIVVLRKDYGCSIVEIKDWSIDSYNYKNSNSSEDGTEWYSKSSGAPVTSPHLQVVNYKRRLFLEADLDLHKRFNESLYGIVKTIIVLTNTSDSDAKVASHKYVPVIGRDGLPDDAETLLKVLGLDRYSTLFKEMHYLAFLRVLDPPSEPIEPVIRVGLSDRQKSALQLPASNRRKIRGVAGSGKTVVGVTLAAIAAASSREVLIVVYNNAAKSSVQHVVDSIDLVFPRSAVTVETIFKLAQPFIGLNEGDHLLSKHYFEAAHGQCPVVS